MRPEFKEALLRVDWVRVVHRVSTLVRVMRSDMELEDDHQVEQARGRKLLHSLDGAARQAFNCRAPSACSCPLCED